MAYSRSDCHICLKSRIFCILLVLSFVSSFVDDQPYCALRYRRLCRGKGRHVGCEYPHAGPGEGCQNYTQIKFTAKLRHFIISYINRRRQRIAAGTERVRGGALIPKPQIMMMVVWDRELELLAQRLADQCSFIHDDCRATVRYPYAGQTVGEVRWRGSSSVSDTLSAQRAVQRVFDAWWGERRRVQPQQLVAPFRMGNKGSAWGHFSQLAVWSLSAAGCGSARHGSPHRLLLVCDFSHTNMLGQSTLTPGELVPCPLRYARKSRSAYPLLCAPVRVPDQAGNEDEEYRVYEENTLTFYDDDDVTANVTSNVTVKTTPTPRIKSAATIKIKIPTYTKFSDLGILKKSTKPILIDKLEQELEPTTWYIATKYNKKKTKEHFDHIRENHESKIKLKESHPSRKSKEHKKFKTMSSSQPPEQVTIAMTRRKWKHTRQRPRRPGADKLVSKPAEKIQRTSGESLKLDRDDMEQLFRDTGFHKHWKKEFLP